MSSYIVFDSRYQRYWSPSPEMARKIEYEEAPRVMMKASCALMGTVCLGVAAMSYLVRIDIHGRDMTSTGFIFGVTGVLTCGAAAIHRYKKVSMERNIQAIVQRQKGWDGFLPARPDPGIPCFVVNYVEEQGKQPPV